MIKLQYRVLHAQIVATQREIEHEGVPATLTVNRLVVEAEPIGHDSGTLEIKLPVGQGYNEGDLIEVTISGALPVEEAA